MLSNNYKGGVWNPYDLSKPLILTNNIMSGYVMLLLLSTLSLFKKC